MDVRYLVLILFFLTSCMPESTVSRGNMDATSATGGSTSGASGGTTTPTSATLKWNYLGQLTSNITISVSNLNTAYLVGTPVENFLATSTNFSNADYCLVTTYSIGGVSRELRSRIVPISYYDFTAKKTVKNFRVDFPDLINSSSVCSKTTRVQNSSGTYIADPATPPASLRTFDPSQICPLCTTTLLATKVRIFRLQTSSNTLDEVPTLLLNSTLLAMQVDPNASSTGGAGTCTNVSCQARGFNCCLDNQCVDDGAQRPSAASQYPALLQTAEQDRLQNPLAYLNYPQLYYICGNTVPTNPGGTTGSTTGGTTAGGTTGGTGYDAAFEQLKKDYNCIQNLKAQATTTPFHNEVLTKSYLAATDCFTSSSDSSQFFYYQNVMKRLYTTCGCNRTDLTDMINSCPNYDYTVTTKDTANQPIRIDCYTPPVNNNPVPSQQTVTFSSRTAPHRFYDVNGVEKSPSAGIDQEGTKFEYLDTGNILPQQQPFSMNAILGQMSVALDKALPAKTVNVEIDQVYFLSTTSGYFTPCPSCGKDSWLTSFTAFPSSTFGNGLQAVGYTTERDVLGFNTTGGNYEDTIFGRACWIPPTMIPYSHSPKTTLQAQRLNRLETQSALFANGYQRDWFGFNKGALIGSFDGVSWFAIGTGRIIKSTSKKLYLAINAPFADLANASMHVVNVQAYDGITQAAQVDYDPAYHQTHPLQNQAANCQKFHMCSTDTDCVTRLGWEYACADVKDLKTNWPTFDANGNELVNTSANLTLDQILTQKRFPTGSTKRCVYRGSGAVCHTRVDNLLATDLNKTKLLTCAPNFYCAQSSSGRHNNKISRYAAALTEIPVSRNHLFGKDANVLGRPENYLGTNGINANITATLIENLTTVEPTMPIYTGLCQPGKNLPSATNQAVLMNPFEQHKAVDASGRTDFISQIGSCNSTLFTTNRHTSCPVLGSDGNYEIFSQATLPVGFALRATNQNACGLESLLSTAGLNQTADVLSNSSPFRNIEAKTLSTQIVVDKTLARDACFRRAGSACHTDLDCSPNKMHADQTDLFATTYFGNNAEKSYWNEYLVCGQTAPKPTPGATDEYKNYDMSKNRCCREIGKDLTTFTRDIPTRTAAGSYDVSSAGLKMSIAPGIIPNDPKRYSRLATVNSLGTSERPSLTAFQDRTAVAPNRYLATDSDGQNVMTPNQWKTLSEANSETCCGGGWIRKFSDGSNDWTRRDRLVLDVTNFKCINSRSLLITSPTDLSTEYTSVPGGIQNLITQDFGDYCKDATNLNGSCAQFSILDSAQDILPEYTAATDYAATITVNTLKPDYTSTNKDYYFTPRSGDANFAVIVDYTTASRRNITLKVPSFVTDTFNASYVANSLTIRMVSNAGDSVACSKDAAFNPTSANTTYGPGAGCYFSYNHTTRLLKVAAGDGLATGLFAGKKIGVEFTTATPGVNSGRYRSKPGSTAYYLKRLGSLELSGIPQITHEALYCNDDRLKIVPGIYEPSKKYFNDFLNNTYAFLHDYLAKTSSTAPTQTTVTGLFTNQYGLQHDPVFSANDFKCCTPLGKTPTDASKCCSGYAVGDTDKTCALPSGTDLMVYFNSFVSNEGRSSDSPGGGLVETDFDARTGEPLILTPVNDKIRALGAAYCESGSVRQGGAFGSFEPEPQGSQTNLSQRIYNLVDSPRDNGQNSNAGTTVATGYSAFTDGFKWNHHLYCDD